MPCVWQNIDSSVERHDLCTHSLSRALAQTNRRPQCAEFRVSHSLPSSLPSSLPKDAALSHSHRDERLTMTPQREEPGADQWQDEPPFPVVPERNFAAQRLTLRVLQIGRASC